MCRQLIQVACWTGLVKLPNHSRWYRSLRVDHTAGVLDFLSLRCLERGVILRWAGNGGTFMGDSVGRPAVELSFSGYLPCSFCGCNESFLHTAICLESLYFPEWALPSSPCISFLAALFYLLISFCSCLSLYPGPTLIKTWKSAGLPQKCCWVPPFGSEQMPLCGLGSPAGPPPGNFCNLGPAQLEAAITTWSLITQPNIRSVYRGSLEPVSKGQPEVLSRNSPLVIAVQGKRH